MTDKLKRLVSRQVHKDYSYEANLFWSVKFLSQPYTSLCLIDYLLKKANLSHVDLVEDHNILKKTFKKAEIVADVRETSMISPLPGTCTSFTIQVVEQLEKTYENMYDFQFYRLGTHTLARCEKTGVLIDSSSSAGAITLNEGQWVTFGGDRDKWAWNSQTNKFEKSKPESTQDKEFSTALSRDQCMANSLSAIAANAQLLCYFRESLSDVKNGARFFAMIKWLLKEKRLQLSEVYKSTDAGDIKLDIVWDGNGDAQSETQCLQGIEQFVAFCGGQDGPRQWKTCDEPHMKLWAAAKKKWGYPRALFPEERPADRVLNG